MKTIYLTVELSIDEDVDPADVAMDLFGFLVSGGDEDWPEIITSVNGCEVRRA
jgi:hypothetical protein